MAPGLPARAGWPRTPQDLGTSWQNRAAGIRNRRSGGAELAPIGGRQIVPKIQRTSSNKRGRSQDTRVELEWSGTALRGDSSWTRVQATTTSTALPIAR